MWKKTFLDYRLGEPREQYHCVLKSKLVLEHTVPFFFPIRDLDNKHLSSNALPEVVVGIHLKWLQLCRNNWDSDTFEFDEVLIEFASQKRIYKAVAQPVVESDLDGYNGTVMAYGRTGTSKLTH
ncbi:kinesin-like protein KIN-UB [Tanacetum coccineum]